VKKSEITLIEIWLPLKLKAGKIIPIYIIGSARRKKVIKKQGYPDMLNVGLL
jgi:hypothetical protein